MNLADRDLSHYIRRTTTEADLTRQWRQLAATLERPARRGVGWAVALGAAYAAGAIALMLWRGKGQADDDGGDAAGRGAVRGDIPEGQ